MACKKRINLLEIFQTIYTVEKGAFHHNDTCVPSNYQIRTYDLGSQSSLFFKEFA